MAMNLTETRVAKFVRAAAAEAGNVVTAVAQASVDQLRHGELVREYKQKARRSPLA